ncbi:MAG: endo-1,4-beta-xylanase [Treponema sp.]|nr:endo-1,4-beta-xylanase [Treponema sp.]
MKKSILLLLCVLSLLFFSCKKESPATIINRDGSVSILKVDEDGKAVLYDKKFQEFTGVTKVKLSKTEKRNPITIDLSEYSNKDALIDFNMDIFIDDPSGKTNTVVWVLNDVEAKLPHLADAKIEANKWTNLNSQFFVHIGENRQIFLSGAGFDKENVTIYIKNLNVQLSGDGIGTMKSLNETWTQAPSIKEAYKGIFDYFGFAVTFNNYLDGEEIQAGVKHHADVITMGNEFKPDFVFGWGSPYEFVDFTGEDGKTYKVPFDRPRFVTVDRCLQICKDNGLKMRSHVLVWHSQTPEWFFMEEYGLGESGDYVGVDEMNARLEWYIKNFMEHVANWEKENNNGEHIIVTWDVVNEAASDGATDNAYLRTESNWYEIYNNEDFIVNAFRYANKYAPKDVELVYNDYNCYQDNKLKAICKIIDAIQAAPDARIDAIGMQSHVNINSPAITGKKSFESAVQTFVSKGLNVQVTELDIANGKEPYNPYKLKGVYKNYFEMFIKNRKTETSKGIEGVSIWGLEDEGTWLNNLSQYNGNTQYPLLFTGEDFKCKPAFYGVLEAAESFTE